jgi:hypothetical protein
MSLNGESVPVSPSVKDRLTRALAALIPGMQNNGEVKDLRLSLRRKR